MNRIAFTKKVFVTTARVVVIWLLCAENLRREQPQGETISTGASKRRQPVRQIIEDSELDEDALAEPLGLVEEVGSVKGVYQPPILASLHLDSMEVSMEVDTGASLSVMSDKQCNKLWPEGVLNQPR